MCIKPRRYNGHSRASARRLAFVQFVFNHQLMRNRDLELVARVIEGKRRFSNCVFFSFVAARPLKSLWAILVMAVKELHRTMRNPCFMIQISTHTFIMFVYCLHVSIAYFFLSTFIN